MHPLLLLPGALSAAGGDHPSPLAGPDDLEDKGGPVRRGAWILLPMYANLGRLGAAWVGVFCFRTFESIVDKKIAVL